MNMRRLALWFSLSSAMVVGVACSSDPETPSGGTPTVDPDASSTPKDGSPSTPYDANVAPTVTAACTSLATAICSKIESCSAPGLKVLYGDADACKERNILACTTSAVATGQTATAENLNSCASSIGSVACGDALSLKFGAACTIPGTLENGTACGYNGQCKSTFCALAGDKSCGTCAPLTTEGAACVNGACSAGLACSEVDTKCRAPGTAQVGAACNQLSDCETGKAVCNTVGKKCISLAVAEAGGKCGVDSLLNPTKYTACSGGAVCDPPTDGTCSAVAADGADCSAKGPGCLSPARCVAGKCTLPQPNCK